MHETRRAHSSKYWPHFVNLYREAWLTNAGLENASEFTDKQLKQSIESLKMFIEGRESAIAKAEGR